MSVYVNQERCTGCNGLEEPVCVRYCPGDLMKVNKETGKAEIRNGTDCWDCMVCIKLCPFKALETKLPYQLASYKASLIPELLPDRIIWRLKDINDGEDVFEVPTKGA